MNKEMEKIISNLEYEFSKLRTDTVSTNIIEDIKISYYGDNIPISNVATISLIDRRTISIQPWDTTVTKTIEKAILEKNLGATPFSDSNSIRLSFPPLTTDRRRELTKIASSIAEDHKISIRLIRQNENNRIKKRTDINDGQKRSFSNNIQKNTDEYISKIQNILEQKIKDIMIV